jgi:hypothetical protein
MKKYKANSQNPNGDPFPSSQAKKTAFGKRVHAGTSPLVIHQAKA